MTLLIAFRLKECIVLAHDLRGTSADTHDEGTFKFGLLEPGVVALYAGDVGIASSILQTANLDAPKHLLPFGPLAWAEVVQEIATRRYARAYGADATTWGRDGVPQVLFVVAGFHNADGPEPRPVVYELRWDRGFQPESPSGYPLLRGDSIEVAEYVLSGWNTFGLTEYQAQVLAAFLIRETAKVSNTVSALSQIHTIRTGRVSGWLDGDDATAVHGTAMGLSSGILKGLRQMVEGLKKPPPESA